ncbi:hypothetical protein [Microbacterium sp. P02]
MSPRQLRALRGTAVASAATVIAAVAHTLGGGGAPAPAFVLALAVLASPISVALVGRRLSTVRTALAVATSQVLFHVAFAVVGDVAPSAASPSAGHAHDMSTMLAEATVASSGGDVGMIGAHLLAGIVTAALILRAERVIRAVAGGVRRMLDRLSSAPMPRPEPESARPVVRVIALPASTYRSDVSRRGPPPRFARA